MTPIRPISGRFPPRCRHCGISLIEILVTVLVISIGILSAAGLQLLSKRSNFEAVQRTSASMLALDILERMRANPTVLATYVAGVGANGLGGGVLTKPTDCSSVDCGPQQLAAYDLWEWEQAIDGVAETNVDDQFTGGLVIPTGCIIGPVDGLSGTYTVAIAWYGHTELSNPTSHACGSGLGKYGDGDRFRRVLFVEGFIYNE